MSTAKDRIHTFFLVREPQRPDRVVVWDTQDITFGRAQENDIAVDHVEISRRHAQFNCTGKNFVVQNLSTSNGTRVNGEEVSTHVLESGDVVHIAEVELRFYQSAKDPVALGKPLQYSSELKDFVGPTITAADADSTVLGLVDTLSGSDDVFEVRPANDFNYELHGIEKTAQATVPRDLDRELENLGLDDLDLPEDVLEPKAPPRAAGTPEFLVLDDDDDAAPAATALAIEITGLTGELRKILEGFAGKVIELPPLKLRIRDGDLD